MNSEPSLFRVLLVEDEPADAHLVRLALQESRLPVDMHHVVDGIEALAFLRREVPYRNVPRPDLILLDLNLPCMDGRKFLASMKTEDKLRAIPVVVLTTSDAETDIVACYTHGAAGFIVKPMDMDQLVAKIRGLQDYWVGVVRRPAR